MLRAVCTQIEGIPNMRPSMPAIGIILLIGAVKPSLAAACNDRPVSARGDSSRFELLAKSKARGNWRAKVRALPALGASYADWSKAQAAEYRCSQKDSRFECIAVAYPCRS